MPSTKKTGKLPVPYERIVQWAAGPVSILAGILGTLICNNIGAVKALGIGHNAVAQVVYSLGIFLVSAGVTYAAHHKWLANVPKWWAHQQQAQLHAAVRAAPVAKPAATPPASAAKK